MLKRVLKGIGSIYLHCDSTASHYLKLLLDAVFDPRNFRNDIVWKRRVGSSSAVHSANRFGDVTDNILFYAKSAEALFQVQYSMDAKGYDEYLAERFKFTDDQGRKFRTDNLANPAPRPNLMYEYKGYKPPKNGWAISREKMELWDKEGRLYFPKKPDGRIARKRFLSEVKGKPVQNLWDDIAEINSQAQERLGYPTQKPEALLERILNASCPDGGTVLDPFCGCGTTIAAAQKMGLNWIGIDITHIATALIKSRLLTGFGLEARRDYAVVGEPADLASAEQLARDDPYQFQWWSVSLVGISRGPDQKKGADKGIDGRLYFHDEAQRAKGTKDDNSDPKLLEGVPSPKRLDTKQVIFSVKAGHATVAHVRDLRGVLDREKAQIGVLITMQESTQPMRTEAASAGFYKSFGGQFPKIQILTVRELLDGRKVDMPAWHEQRTFKAAPKVKSKGATKQPEMFQ